jgi:hypothetical protein
MNNKSLPMSHPGRRSVYAVASILCLFSFGTASAGINLITTSVTETYGINGVTSQVNIPAQASGQIKSEVSTPLAPNAAYARNDALAGGANFGSISSSVGNGSASTTLHKEISFTADQTAVYSLSSLLNAGRIYTIPSTGITGSGSASLDWSISLDGVVLNDIHMRVFSDTNVTGLNPNAALLTGSAAGSLAGLYYYTVSPNLAWTNSTISTSLGLLTAGSSHILSMDLNTSAVSSYSAGGSALSPYSSYNYAYGFLCANNCGASHARMNSNSSQTSLGSAADLLYTSPNVFDTPVISAIPEPSEWALLLAGIGAVGAISKRQRAKRKSTVAY